MTPSLVIFALILIALLYPYPGLLRTVIEGALSKSWKKTNGVIRVSKVGEHSESMIGGASSEATHLDLLYQYEVDGTTYQGTRLNVSGSMTTSDDKTAKLAFTMKEGSSVTVYYNPRKPAQAVLQNGIPFPTLFFFLLLSVTIAGLTLWWWSTP